MSWDRTGQYYSKTEFWSSYFLKVLSFFSLRNATKTGACLFLSLSAQKAFWHNIIQSRSPGALLSVQTPNRRRHVCFGLCVKHRLCCLYVLISYWPKHSMSDLWVSSFSQNTQQSFFPKFSYDVAMSVSASVCSKQVKAYKIFMSNVRILELAFFLKVLNSLSLQNWCCRCHVCFCLFAQRLHSLSYVLKYLWPKLRSLLGSLFS